MTCISVVNFFKRGISYFRLGLGEPLQELVRGVANLYFTPTFFSKGVSFGTFLSSCLGFWTPLGSWLGALVTFILVHKLLFKGDSLFFARVGTSLRSCHGALETHDLVLNYFKRGISYFR